MTWQLGGKSTVTSSLRAPRYVLTLPFPLFRTSFRPQMQHKRHIVKWRSSMLKNVVPLFDDRASVSPTKDSLASGRGPSSDKRTNRNDLLK